MSKVESERMQLSALQTAIARLKAERDYVQQLIQQYDQLLNARLGVLLARLSALQQAVETSRATHSRRRSEQDTLVDWQPPSVAQPGFSATPPIPTPPKHDTEPAPAAAVSLKKLYRRAVALAHPDLFAGDTDREARATEFMGQLNAAYAREDTDAVQQLLADWEEGLPFLDLPGHEPDPQTLARIMARLTHTRDALVREIAVLRQTEAYRIMSDETINLSAHFDSLEQRCLAQIELLMKQVA